MDRRLILGTDWATIRRDFRWRIPARFNIATACCDDWAAADPGRVAIRHRPETGEGRDWTYGALKDASDRLASALAARGLGRGAVVALLLPQGPEVMIAHFAAMKLGAVSLPLFSLFGPEALAYRLGDAKARVVVTDGDGIAKIEALRPALPDLAEVIVVGGGPAPSRDFWAEIARAAPRTAPCDTAAEDPAILIYTSGTTGAPKGVLHAHRFLLGHLPNVEVSQGLFPRTGAVGWTPADWAWIGGLMDLAMPCLYHGVPVVARRMRKFDADAAFRLIRDEGVTNLFLPPTALKLMRGARVPGGLRVRAVASGGESLGADMLDWGRSALGAPINEIYGQTECNLVVSSAEGLFATHPGWMGRASPGAEVAVIGPDGGPVAEGALGEIAVRRGHPAMFLGYLGRPEATAAKFAGDWMRTGDLGRRDAEGYLAYVARDDDIIASAGYRVGPSEIENCLTGHPDVVMAACVGVPDAVRGEAIKAFVVLREGAQWEGLPETLAARVRERLSPHLVPRQFERRDRLPMTATGKILRRDLRG